MNADYDALVQAMEKVQQARAAQSEYSARPREIPRFRKTGAMEYTAYGADGLASIMEMLAALSLGYTIQTVHEPGGVLKEWTISIYDPATMQELAR